MHYLALLLEKVADLFPLCLKLVGFSLLVHQIAHQWDTFNLEYRWHMTGRNDNVIFSLGVSLKFR